MEEFNEQFVLVGVAGGSEMGMEEKATLPLATAMAMAKRPRETYEIFRGLEEQYAFVGGEHAEYLKYFHRSLPQQMWHWDVAEKPSIVSLKVAVHSNVFAFVVLLVLSAAQVLTPELNRVCTFQ